MLETTNFLVYETEQTAQPMNFYDAKDFAYNIGLLVGHGELQENVEEPSTEIIEAAYANIQKEEMRSFLTAISGAVREALEVVQDGELKTQLSQIGTEADIALAELG